MREELHITCLLEQAILSLNKPKFILILVDHIRESDLSL